MLSFSFIGLLNPNKLPIVSRFYYPNKLISTKDIVVGCYTHGLFKLDSIYKITGINPCLECRALSNNKQIKSFLSNLIDFEKIHPNKYKYPEKTKRIDDYFNVFCKVSNHGIFKTTPHNLKSGYGCPKCGKLTTGWTSTKWEERAKASKYFDSYKVYIIKCFNDNEEFIKIGRTFTTVDIRFKSKRLLPYSYQILNTFIFNSSKECQDYEIKLHKLFTNYKYLPMLSFKGQTECYSLTPDLINFKGTRT